jgi:hypothetical protein
MFPDSEKMAKFKCYNYPTAFNNLQDTVHHHVKNYTAFTSMVKEKILEGKSGKWGFQTKHFHSIAGDVLSNRIFLKME